MQSVIDWLRSKALICMGVKSNMQRWCEQNCHSVILMSREASGLSIKVNQLLWMQLTVATLGISLTIMIHYFRLTTSKVIYEMICNEWIEASTTATNQSCVYLSAYADRLQSYATKMQYFCDVQVDAEWSVMQQTYTCTQKGQIQHAVKPAAVRGWKIDKHFTIQ